jgi:fatty acid desaturase
VVDVEKDSASVVAMWFSMVVILLFFAAIFSFGKIFVMIVGRYISLLDFGTVSSQFRFYVPFSNLYDCRYITKVGMMNSNVDPTHQFLCHHICTQEVNASIPRMIGSLLFEVIRLIYIYLE